MMQVLIALAWGVGTFAIIVGLMSIITQKFAAVGCTRGGFSYYNTSTGVCTNNSEYNDGNGNVSTPAATATTYYLQGQLGSTGGGLSTYAPIIIVVGVAFIIFAAFGGKSKKY